MINKHKEAMLKAWEEWHYGSEYIPSVSLAFEKGFDAAARGGMRMTMSKLQMKPCPCCGSQDVHVEKAYTGTSGYFVECYSCGLQTAAWLTGEKAVSYWNRREE